jgi:hypothetical protein
MPPQQADRLSPVHRPALFHVTQARPTAAGLLREADEAARNGDLCVACALLSRATTCNDCNATDATEVMAKIYIRGGDFAAAKGLLEHRAPFASGPQLNRFLDLEQLCVALAALEKGRWEQAKAGAANVRCPETRASLSRLVSNASLVFPQEDL